MRPPELERLQHNSRSVFFDIRNEYAFLKPRDVIQVVSSGTKQETAFAALTHRFECSVSQLYERHPELQWELRQRLGREPDPAEIVHVLELKIAYKIELDPSPSEAPTHQSVGPDECSCW
jgi:hypothetical protein